RGSAANRRRSAPARSWGSRPTAGTARAAPSGSRHSAGRTPARYATRTAASRTARAGTSRWPDVVVLVLPEVPPGHPLLVLAEAPDGPRRVREDHLPGRDGEPVTVEVRLRGLLVGVGHPVGEGAHDGQVMGVGRQPGGRADQLLLREVRYQVHRRSSGRPGRSPEYTPPTSRREGSRGTATG